jgi:demethylmenaquinone methyltransferase/2-methoxy-6-polyprenyl-1,4-benzoquinol methylase
MIRDLYRVRARRYDLTANLYYLIGFREQHYRKRAVEALRIREGDVVVEIGGGTGLNFSLLQRKTGPAGKIIGVDLTDRMLQQAEKRVTRHGWRNVELVRTDAGAFAFPSGTNKILSTFAITLMPEFDRIILNGKNALPPGGRLAILDLKQADWAPRWLTRMMVWLTSPFGVSLDLTSRHPWESVAKYFPNSSYEEYFIGFVYLSLGEA